MAQPDSKQAHRKQGARRQPITRHPLFPAVVALWFAALLALGSFALSTRLIENLVLAARIDSIVHLAAPPLGATARLVLALLLGLMGGAAGWILARYVTAPKTVAAPQVFNVADADLGAPPQWPGVAETSGQNETVMLAEPPALFEPAVAAVAPPMLDPASLIAEVEAPLPAAEVVVEQQAIPALPAPAAARTAAQRIADADLAQLSHVELVERLAIALQRREELTDASPQNAAERTAPVLHFPDFADRRSARLTRPAAQSRAVPQETEKALREALAQLERISGCA